MNSDQYSATSRRRFLAGSACGVTAISLTCNPKIDAHESVAGDFAETLRLNLNVTSPRRITVSDDGTVCLAAGNKVQKINGQGEVMWTTMLDRAARCLCCHGGDILVGIKGVIVALDLRDGSVVSETKIPLVRLPGDIAVIGESIYVSDVNANCWFTRGLESRDLSWRRINPVDSVLTPASRWVPTSSGGMLVTDPSRHRVIVANGDGVREKVWGRKARQIDGFQGCCNPMAIGELPDGTLVTAEAGQVRIKRFNAKGEFVDQIASPDDIETPAVSRDNDPSLNCGVGGIDIAVSSQGDLWVLHSAAKQLIRYTT